VVVFRASVRDRIVAVSPCVDIRLPRSSTTAAVTEVLSRSTSCGGRCCFGRHWALIVAPAGLGLRPGELFGLNVDRVDFLRSQVRVDQQMVRVRGEGVVLTPKLKTPTAHRTLPLPDVVAQAAPAHTCSFAPHPNSG
jgi:hypothetical protein